MEAAILDHPYSPEAKWRIAVSRKFHVDRAEKIYGDLIHPVLDEEGLVLECYYAGNDTLDAEEFWVSRMGLILELSDIHILLDVERSANVAFEFQLSASMQKHSKLVTTGLVFDWHPLLSSKLFRPISIHIDDKNGKDTFSERKRCAELHLGSNPALADVQTRLRRCLEQAKLAQIKTIAMCDSWVRGSSRLAGEKFETTREVLVKATQIAEVLAKRDSHPSDLEAVMGPMHRHAPELQRRMEIVNNQWADWNIAVSSGKITLPERFWDSYHLIRHLMMESYKESGFLSEHMQFNRPLNALFSFLALGAALSMRRESRKARRAQSS